MKYFYLLIFISSSLFSQTDKEREYILKHSNTTEGFALKKRFNDLFSSEEQQIREFLLKNPNFTSPHKIQRFIDGQPIFFQEDNNALSVETSRAESMYPLGSLGLSVTGQGITIGIWDGGRIRDTHVEFAGRVVLLDAAPTLSNHANHVLGTMIAGGVSPARRGFAYQANAWAYDFNSDSPEILSFAGEGLLLSNHSYGNIATSLQTSTFGAYNAQSVEADQIMNAYPYYQMVKSAGNDRNNGALNQALIKDGYDLLTGVATAKNVITVGAILGNVLSPDPEYNPFVISDFSNFGPTDDGRIKPDIVAKGVGVNSVFSTSNTAYGSLQGTSMSAPAVTGLIALLQKHFNNLNSGTYMKSATVRGLLAQTAREVGDNLGPDYIYGWGVADGLSSAQLITNRNNNTAILDERVLTNNEVYTRNITINSPQNLNVVVSWTDPTGVANSSSSVDNRTPRLINNLDLKIIKDGTIYYPWKLNPDAVLDASTNNSDNNVDNIERVEVFNATPGVYTIQVTHKATLQGGSQAYTLIASGTNGLALNTSDFVADNNFFVYPNPANNLLNYSNPNNIELSSISITDITGKQVIAVNAAAATNAIDVSNLQTGVYFVKFTTENKSFVKKFIKN